MITDHTVDRINLREELIEHAMNFLCDIIPHDSTNYFNEVRTMAERYADLELECGTW